MARIVYTDMSGQERSVPIGNDAPVVSIGRATDCTIRSNRKSVSRRHAEFRFANGQFEVVDLNSSNGTYLIINDERKPVHGREYLAHNDEVWCGDFILRFFEQESADVSARDDDTFNPQPPPVQAGSTQPPGFGEPQQQPGFGGSNQFGQPNGQFGQPQQQQHSWSPQQNPQQGGFGNSGPSQFGSPQNAPFGAEPSFEPSFGSEASFGNEPSFANDPPDFGEPVKKPTHEGATRQSPGYEADFIDNGPDERLVQERDAYAELADRQKGEIDDLQSRLRDMQENFEETRRELEELRDNDLSTSVASSPAQMAQIKDDLEAAHEAIEALQHDLRSAQNETASVRQQLDAARADGATTAALEQQVDALQDANSALEHELAHARQQASEPDPATEAEIAELRDQLAGKDRDVLALESEVDRLSEAMRSVEQDAATQAKQDAQKGREETEALRRELDRHKRLVEEFEKRNRELQTLVDGADDAAEVLAVQKGESDAKRAELEAELEALAGDLEAARTERDQAQHAIEQMRAEGSVTDLKNEIDGLKHRLKMEKERAGAGDAKLAEEVDRLSAHITELEAENVALREHLDAASVEGGVTAEVLSVLHEKVGALDRIVDAIVRTNLDPLSTVDRIRLQSAIRDTEPKATLASLLELTSSD